MKKIDPNLLKLAAQTCDLSIAPPNLEEIPESPEEIKEIKGFIYVPSIKLYIAEQRTHLNKNWFDTHKELHKQNLRMPTIPEFIAFLNYLKENPSLKNTNIYKDITEVRSPWRAEWLDADFKVINTKLHINYAHQTINGKLIPQSTIELTDYLEENKQINLEYWLNHATPEGLPTKNTPKGSLYYWAPMKDNKSVAGFVAVSFRANLGCYWDPSFSYASLGVFACAEGAGVQNFSGDKQ